MYNCVLMVFRNRTIDSQNYIKFQKVDYEYIHQEHTGLSYVRDPMKGSTYEMMDVPLPQGPVSRPRIIIPNPVFDDNFPSAYPKDLGQSIFVYVKHISYVILI